MSLFGGISSLLGGGGSGGGGGLGNVFNQVSSFGQQVVHVVDHADPNILNMHDQIQSLIGEGHTVIPVNGIGGNLEQIVQQISSQVPRGSIGSLNFFSSGLTGEHSPLLDRAGDMVAQFGGVEPMAGPPGSRSAARLTSRPYLRAVDHDLPEAPRDLVG